MIAYIMIKYKHPLAFIILLPLYCCSQGLKRENLVNYSYIINGRDSIGFMTSGTGSIIHYIDKYYLVTNFHVLTGRDVKTNKKFPELRNTNTSISIIFQAGDRKSKFLVYIYPLFDKKGLNNFDTFTFQHQLIDIAIMPISTPREASLFSISIEDIDTNCNRQSQSKLMIFGFPGGRFVNGWQPTELHANSVDNPQSGRFIYDPFIFFDEYPIKGISGSPIYHKDKNGLIKLLSIVSNLVDYNKETPNIKGRSICATLALYLIKKSYSENKHPIKGVKYLYR